LSHPSSPTPSRPPRLHSLCRARTGTSCSPPVSLVP
jgi:hypothetical protein